MNKSLITTVMLAALGSAGMALAQTDQTTTTTTETPDATTQSTVTKTHDADGGYTEYRKTVTASKHFQIGPWQAPADFTAHHYVLGDHLSTELLATNYYLDNYQTYALVAPPDGTVWIRVNADAFLVRRDNGEVIQADYGMFE